jgi:hypothetical protein
VRLNNSTPWPPNPPTGWVATRPQAPSEQNLRQSHYLSHLNGYERATCLFLVVKAPSARWGMGYCSKQYTWFMSLHWLAPLKVHWLLAKSHEPIPPSNRGAPVTPSNQSRHVKHNPNGSSGGPWVHPAREGWIPAVLVRVHTKGLPVAIIPASSISSGAAKSPSTKSAKLSAMGTPSTRT